MAAARSFNLRDAGIPSLFLVKLWSSKKNLQKLRWTQIIRLNITCSVIVRSHHMLEQTLHEPGVDIKILRVTKLLF
jgi:hypothetical protein